MHQPASSARAFRLLAVVVLAWGINWPITKIIVRDVPPLWATSLRCAIAAVVLAVVLRMRGIFVVPKRGDIPVVLSTALLHMTAYSTLIAAGLQLHDAPMGRHRRPLSARRADRRREGARDRDRPRGPRRDLPARLARLE